MQRWPGVFRHRQVHPGHGVTPVCSSEFDQARFAQHIQRFAQAVVFRTQRRRLRLMADGDKPLPANLRAAVSPNSFLSWPPFLSLYRESISAEWGTSDNNRKAKFCSIAKPAVNKSPKIPLTGTACPG
jgi:hypothetical protein